MIRIHSLIQFRVRSLALSALLALGIIALSQAQSLRKVITDGPAVKVHVVDHDTGKPIASAKVYLKNDYSMSGTIEQAAVWAVDAAGFATIRAGQPVENSLSRTPTVAISAHAPGYAPRTADFTPDNADARTILPAALEIRLRKGRPIGGVVLDETGAPQAGVTVQVSGSARPSGNHDGTQFGEYWRDLARDLRTDKEGRWVARDFPEHLINATVQLVRENGSHHSFRYSEPTLRYREGLNDFNFRELFSKQARFVFPSGKTIRGRVVDSKGKPVAGALIRNAQGRRHDRLGVQRTDLAGRFELPNRRVFECIVTAEAKGYALASAIIDPESDQSEMLIELPPESPLRITVLDAEGQPIPGARLAAPRYHNEGHLQEFRAVTDQNGSAIWTNAPLGKLRIDCTAPRAGKGQFQYLETKPGQRELTFHLRDGESEEVIVKIRARDAKTGEPVIISEVGFDAQAGEFKPLATPEQSDFEIRIGSNNYRAGGTAPYFDLFLRPRGAYQPLITPRRFFRQGDWDVELKFTRSATKDGSIVGRILTPDGKPASGAVMHHGYSRRGFTSLPRPQAVNYGSIAVTADAQGRIRMKDPGGARIALIEHKTGFHATTTHALRDGPIRLAPWGRVKGRLMAGTNAVPNFEVSIEREMPPGRLDLMNPELWIFSDRVSTDANGYFDFQRIPPGRMKLFISAHTANQRMVKTRQQSIIVPPGKTIELIYGGDGVYVTGKVQSQHPLQKDLHLLSLKLTKPHLRPLDNFIRYETYKRYFETDYAPRLADYERHQIDYPLHFDAEGNFYIEDVMPGIYELRIRVLDPPKQRFAPGPVRAELIKEVVLDGSANINLGTLVLK